MTAKADRLVKPLGDEVFNPLDKTHLAESVSDRLLKRPIIQLPPKRFRGAGIYAIYYRGGFHAYQRIADPSGDREAIPNLRREGRFHQDRSVAECDNFVYPAFSLARTHEYLA
jgi:hypothetical protein